MYIPCETMLTHPTNFMDILCSTSEVSMICTNSSKEMRVSCKRHINTIPDPDLWNRFRSIWVQHQHRHLVGSGHIKKDIQFDLFVLSTIHTIKKDEQFLHSKSQNRRQPGSDRFPERTSLQSCTARPPRCCPPSSSARPAARPRKIFDPTWFFALCFGLDLFWLLEFFKQCIFLMSPHPLIWFLSYHLKC